MKFRLGFAKDLSYNLLAVVIMNVIIQFIVYPYLNKAIGEEAFGNVLYLLSVIAILANSFGMALNNTRLVIKPQFESRNGDYNVLMMIFCIISCVVAIAVLHSLDALTPINGLFFCVLTVLTLIRYYSDVEYRLTLRYRRYFVYYIIISIGYLLGIILYKFTKNWFLVLACGELAAVLFVLPQNTIYQKPFICSKQKAKVWKITVTVAGSYLIANFFQNIDRIVLQNLMGGDAVTTFYTASVLGKTVALLIGPINGVMIAYLARYSGSFSKGIFSKAVLLAVALSGICFIGCILVSPWLIRTFYPNVYSTANGLIGIATLGQILFFTAGLLLAVILRFCHQRYQFTIQIIYGIVYVALAVPATINMGIEGFAYATLWANLIRFALVLVVGYKDAGKREIKEKASNEKQ